MRRFPPYPPRAHASGQARIRIHGKDYYLGDYGSKASKVEYARLATLFAVEPESVGPKPKAITIAETASRFLKHLGETNGKRWREMPSYKRAVAVLDRLYGTTPATDFRAKDLRVVQTAMVNGSWMNDEEKQRAIKQKREARWSVGYANHQISRIRTLFRWAETEGHVSPGTWQHLQALPGLRSNAPGLRTTKPRQAVEWSQVEATLPYLSPALAAITQVQWWSGMRPSEVIGMRAGDVAGNLYTITDHKTAWRGKTRVVVLGEEALAVLGPWLALARQRGPESFVFPADRRGKRSYGTTSYGRAITRACEEAKVKHWTPYQIRHAAKQRFTREFGLDAARAALGQSSLGATNGYSSAQDLELAQRVARKCG